MLSKDQTTARQLETIMHDIYQRIGLDHHTYVTTINQQGVKII
jgi:homoserine kinase